MADSKNELFVRSQYMCERARARVHTICTSSILMLKAIPLIYREMQVNGMKKARKNIVGIKITKESTKTYKQREVQNAERHPLNGK